MLIRILRYMRINIGNIANIHTKVVFALTSINVHMSISVNMCNSINSTRIVFFFFTAIGSNNSIHQYRYSI